MPFRRVYPEYRTHGELPAASPHWEVLGHRSWRLPLIEDFPLGFSSARKPSSPALSCQPRAVECRGRVRMSVLCKVEISGFMQAAKSNWTSRTKSAPSFVKARTEKKRPQKATCHIFKMRHLIAMEETNMQAAVVPAKSSSWLIKD